MAQKPPEKIKEFFKALRKMPLAVSGVIFSDGEMTVGDKSLHSDQLTFA
jgi:hypothetical protein